MALFDAVIGNTDRHGGNYLTSLRGDLVAIDHGLAFPEGLVQKGISGNYNAMERLANNVSGGSALTAAERAQLEALVARKSQTTSELLDVGLPQSAVDDLYARVGFMLDEDRMLNGAADFGGSFLSPTRGFKNMGKPVYRTTKEERDALSAPVAAKGKDVYDVFAANMDNAAPAVQAEVREQYKFLFGQGLNHRDIIEGIVKRRGWE